MLKCQGQNSYNTIILDENNNADRLDNAVSSEVRLVKEKIRDRAMSLHKL